MHEPPTDVSDDEVLAAVRSHWDDAVVSVTHLPVGFGAWHWRADAENGPSFFVTLDPPWWHNGSSIEATYAATAALATDLEFVHPPLPTVQGRFAVPWGQGWFSLTRWVEGQRPGRVEPVIPLVQRLHEHPPPQGVRQWHPSVRADAVEELGSWCAPPWTQGPHGERARQAVLEHLSALRPAVVQHQRLAAQLDPDTYVLTHGEPGTHNQWRTREGHLLLLDWESLRLAPRERDLVALPDGTVPHDGQLARLMRLEWSLAEVRTYSDWLRGPHQDDQDTRTGLDGLLQELAAIRALAQ